MEHFRQAEDWTMLGYLSSWLPGGGEVGGQCTSLPGKDCFQLLGLVNCMGISLATDSCSKTKQHS